MARVGLLWWNWWNRTSGAKRWANDSGAAPAGGTNRSAHHCTISFSRRGGVLTTPGACDESLLALVTTSKVADEHSIE